jgi:heme ABC exporter ATP-binding subunit CcmA
MRGSALVPQQGTPMVSDPSPAAAAIRVEGLGKSYDLRPVLRDVSFALPAGRTLALLGPNGAGKTTLLRVLATLVRPSRGRAEMLGLDVRQDAAEIRRLVGYVGHQPHLYDDLTARENLLFFARLYGLRDGATRAERLLARVGLRMKANERVRTLSRGQVQRLALARGIVHDPAVLLLDEPDTGLDDEAAELLDELLRERAETGRTTVFTTHQLARGLAQSDEVLVLLGGRVAACGPSAMLDVAAIRALYQQGARRAL